MSPEAGSSVDELLTNSDAAMYLAKAAGKGRVAVYDGSMRIGSAESGNTAIPEGLVRRRAGAPSDFAPAALLLQR